MVPMGVFQGGFVDGRSDKKMKFTHGLMMVTGRIRHHVFHWGNNGLVEN